MRSAARGSAISVDTKKKELVGDFENQGREWREKGAPEEVRVHDFVIPELGRAVPYGVYDIADEFGFEISVHHLPPGTSKRNKIEHRLFSFITMNWRGKPLVKHQAIVQLIAATTTKSGLEVRCELDPDLYPAGVKITDAAFDALDIERHEFHGDWNYTITPRDRTPKR